MPPGAEWVLGYGRDVGLPQHLEAVGAVGVCGVSVEMLEALLEGVFPPNHAMRRMSRVAPFARGAVWYLPAGHFYPTHYARANTPRGHLAASFTAALTALCRGRLVFTRHALFSLELLDALTTGDAAFDVTLLPPHRRYAPAAVARALERGTVDDHPPALFPVAAFGQDAARFPTRLGAQLLPRHADVFDFFDALGDTHALL